VIAAGGRVLTPGDVKALHSLHLDEARAASACGERRASCAAAMALALTQAAEAAARWRRAGGHDIRREIIFP
jgi:hypothetical protein